MIFVIGYTQAFDDFSKYHAAGAREFVTDGWVVFWDKDVWRVMTTGAYVVYLKAVVGDELTVRGLYSYVRALPLAVSTSAIRQEMQICEREAAKLN